MIGKLFDIAVGGRPAITVAARKMSGNLFVVVVVVVVVGGGGPAL